MKHLFQWIGAGELLRLDSCALSLIGLCGFTVLFGRFFCGYVCAFGGLGDFVYWLSGLVQKKLLHRKKQFRLPERAVRWGQKVKYLLLVLIAVLCALGVYGKLTGTSPWDVFSRLTALKLPAAGYGAGIALFVLILIGMAAQPPFFCQFLCPMGRGVCPAAGAALRLAAPERYPVHSWVLCLRQALPSGSEAG